MTATTDRPQRPSWLRPGRRRAIVVVALVLFGAALVPAILPFNVETKDGERTCVAIVHGWAEERKRPSDIEMREFVTNLAEMRQYDTDGAYRVEAYLDWLSGPGACVPKSRDRLRPVGKAMSMVMIVGVLALMATRRDRNAA